MSSSVSKIVSERNHRTLMELVLKPGNDICADCKARAPRWASHNLGIFICVSCASIHRKIGTHVSKVKSITLDEWSKEQVEVMKEKGNVKSNALYNPDEARHPPPTNMIDSERDSELERFIRSKYEFKRFMSRKPGPASQHLTVDSKTTSTVLRPRSTPLTDPAQSEPGPPLPPKTPENLPSKLRSSATIPSQNAMPTRSFSQPLPSHVDSDKLIAAAPLKQSAAARPSIHKPGGQTREDLISLQGPSQSSSFPLQYSPVPSFTSIPSQPQIPVQPPTTLGNSPNPFMHLSLGQANTTPTLVASPVSMSTLGPQFPFAHSAPMSSPALHVGATNPFNQIPLTPSLNGTAFSTGPNPFSSMVASTPATPSMQPIMAMPTGAMLHTPPLPYVPPQISAPAPLGSFSPTPFAPGPAAGGLVQNPFAPGQMSFSASGATNPFSAMQMTHTGYSRPSPQIGFGTTAFLSQQQQQQLGPNGFGTWPGQGGHGNF